MTATHENESYSQYAPAPETAGRAGVLLGGVPLRQRRKPQNVEQLDQLWALLLRANALRLGDAGRLAARAVDPHAHTTHRIPAPGYALDVALQKRRLHLTLRGFLDAAEAESMLAELRAALAQLGPGFDVVADVSALGGLTSAALPFFRRAATAFVEAGMRRMVRVVGSARGAATAVARASEGLYEARAVASAAEAALLLDGELAAAEAAREASPPTARPKGRQTAARQTAKHGTKRGH